MRAGHPLFLTSIDTSPLEAVWHIVELLGKIPSPWMHAQFNEEGYLERDGCKNPMEIFANVESLPFHEYVNSIKDEQISLPNVNIGLEGFKPPREVGKKPSSSKVNSKTHPSLFWKPVPLAGTAGIYLIGCSSTQTLVQAAIEKEMVPFPKISVKESTSLTDLLSKILTYKPEDRISLSDITKHPWLTDLVESTHTTDLKRLMSRFQPDASEELGAIPINHV